MFSGARDKGPLSFVRQRQFPEGYSGWTRGVGLSARSWRRDETKLYQRQWERCSRTVKKRPLQC